MELLKILKKVTKLFNTHHFSLYAVGGTVRDFLLKKEVKDFDFVTDATPSEMKEFLENYNDVFQRFGVMIYKIDGIRIEITTLRKENAYNDSRHPDKIEFINDMAIDYLRRDFTINALYMDYNGKIYDFCNGLDDLNKREIRVIGDIDKRMKEDPLRILRALRFSMILNFKISEDLDTYIQNNIELLKRLNIEKVKQEINKMMKCDEEKTKLLLNKYRINLFNID
ncbi:MAG: CCA tRNA nucleotidyltransferase [Erysipelotrichales bacterium]|nr:CCA tRNA nucleotidyltransferase [Erysipelotrichales bacterium]